MDIVSQNIFTDFPSDSDIQRILGLAKKSADALVEFVGMSPISRVTHGLVDLELASHGNDALESGTYGMPQRP